MFGQTVQSVMDKGRLLTADPGESVYAACVRMAKRNTGAVVVMKDGKLVGIFTERDAVFRVIAEGRDPRSTALSEAMTLSPKTIDPGKTFGYAMLVMHRSGFRHLPVVENGVPIGMVSARNALDPALEEFVHEARRRERIEGES